MFVRVANKLPSLVVSTTHPNPYLTYSGTTQYAALMRVEAQERGTGTTLSFLHERSVRFANVKVEHEKANLVITNPGLRADFCFPEFNTIVDLRTAVTSDKSLCRKAATSPGAAAEAGIKQKNDKWRAHVEGQSDVFLAIVHEDGGRLSETAKTLPNRLARHFSCITSEQSFYISYDLQRLHAVVQKGVARLCRAVQPMPLGVMRLRTQAVMDVLGASIRQPEGAPLARSNLPPDKSP